MYNPVFNNVADIQQLCTMVVDGYSQADAGMLPTNLQNNLAELENSVIEGLEIAHDRLTQAQDSPLVDAEKEVYMNIKRKCDDKIPGFADKTVNLNLDEY